MSLEHVLSFFGEEQSKYTTKNKEPLTEAYKPILTASIIREQESLKLFHEVAENIRKSERLRAKLTHDIKNNVSSDDLLLTALECIKEMTGDQAFYNQNIKYLR